MHDMIKQLEASDLVAIYRSRIKKDFAQRERRPLFLLKRLYKAGNYSCLVYKENDYIIGYAAFIYDTEIGSVLLDYFAVDEKLRGSGYGSRFLSYLREYWNDKSGIIIESEDPDAATSADEAEQCKRRISFYERLGAEQVAEHWRMIGVDYRILRLPTGVGTQDNVAFDDLCSLYALSVPRPLRATFIRNLMRINE